jgi:dihydrodipicolinate synthase/N-acetylneuraminate lyase
LSLTIRGAAGGVDMSSDELSALADHPNCFGIKLTCGNIGKGHRVSNYTRSAEFLKRKSAFLNSVIEGGEFQLLPGFSDTLLPALVAHHTGAITSTGGLFPKTVRRLYDQALKGIAGDHKAFVEAVQLQDRVSESDGIAVGLSFQGAVSGYLLSVEP